MIPRPPVVLTAFANDSENRLRLEEEERRIRVLLQDLHDSRRIEYVPLGAATLDDIYRTFNRFHNRIHLFHFSGHSNRAFLQLRDTSARASNLAVLMGMQENLELVFLNACDNEEQRHVLFKHGVKAILGTKASLPDHLAILFSEAFYDALKGGKTLQQSFDTAAAKLKDEIDRGGGLRGIGAEERYEDSLFWKLHSNPNGTANLNWTISDPFEAPLNPDFTTEVELNNEDTNKKLLELCFRGLTPKSQDCQRLWEEYQNRGGAYHIRLKMQQEIYNSFPSFLSVHIRELFTEEAKRLGRIRLGRIRNTYLALSKLLAAIALADLWHTVISKNTAGSAAGLIIRPEYREDLEAYINLRKEASDAFDYVWLFSAIDRIFSDNDVKPFVDELKDLHLELTNDSDSYSAYQFLEFELKRRLLASNISTSEVEDLCEKAEEHLAVLLQHCAFLANYQLVSVNDIRVKKSLRRTEAGFVHGKVTLKGHDETTLDTEAITKKSFTSNQTVVVAKDFQSEDEPLHLSPFVIDENAYKKKGNRDMAKIYIRSGRSDDGKQWYQLCEDLSKHTELPLSEKNTYNVHDLEALNELWDFFIQDLNLNE